MLSAMTHTHRHTHTHTHTQRKWVGSRFEAAEVHSGQLHAMKKAADVCRPLYPFCQREVPGNILQNLFRKAEQFHTLHAEVLSATPYAFTFFASTYFLLLQCM